MTSLVALMILLLTAAPATSQKSASTKPVRKPTTRAVTRPAAAVAVPDPELWTKIAQRKDRELRNTTLARVRQMLESNIVAEQKAALRTLAMTNDIRFDRAPFEQPIRRLLAAGDEEVRAAALQALPNFSIGQDDLPIIAPLIEDGSPRVRSQVAAALVAANGRVGSAELDAAMLRLLDDADVNIRRESMRAINNVDISDAVEAKIIVLTNDPKIGRDAIVLGLSTRPVVSGEVAKRLIELLDDPDHSNVVNRAAFALRNATLEGAERAALDAALLRTLHDSLNASVRDNCITALARSPDPEIWARLAQIAEDPDETDRIREAAARVLRQ